MATEVTKGPDQVSGRSTEEKAVASAQQIWTRYNKPLTYGLTVIVLLVAGFFAYKSFYQAPREEKAAEAIWKAQGYYQQDSFRLALNGDGMNQGFLRVISRYEGTESGNLAKFYSGVCYLHLGDFNNAVKYLKDFSTDQKEVKLRAAGLLGDAYAELGKKQEAVEQYKKAGTIFEKDDVNSPEYLFRAALLSQELGKKDEAIALLNQIKDKYPQNPRAMEAEKYLGKLGELN